MSWIFGSMNCKFTGYSQLIKNKSPGYSGPMKFESYGSLQISLTFGGLRLNLMDISDLWSTNLLNIWGLWSANLLDIWAIWSTIFFIFGNYEGRISWIFVNLLDIHESLGYLGPMKHKSPGCLGPLKRLSRMFWACIIKCSQSAKDKLFFGLTTPEIHAPLCSA